MKTLIMTGAMALTLCGCGADTSTTSEPDIPSHALSWMVGCWESGDGQSREVWAQEADMLLGYSVDIKEARVGFFEQMRLVETKDGYAFIVSPFGGLYVTFAQEARSENSVTFINPENDYPQRIHYEREGQNLNAVISKMDGSKPTPFDKRKCD